MVVVSIVVLLAREDEGRHGGHERENGHNDGGHDEREDLEEKRLLGEWLSAIGFKGVWI